MEVNMSEIASPLRFVILKCNKLYGDLICRQIREFWTQAQVEVFQRGFDALDAIQSCPPDIFITGVDVEDMDGLEHLEPFIERTLPILIVTSRKNTRTCELLRTVRYNGIFDDREEGLNNLQTAVHCVLEKQHYVSPSFAPHLKKPKDITLDSLTRMERMVLAVIGDGSDNNQAADRLRIAAATVKTHRRAIMAKLKMHQKGELMLYAFTHGYVQVTPKGVSQPGFERKIRELVGDA